MNPPLPIDADAGVAARALRGALGDEVRADLRALIDAVDGDGAAWRHVCQAVWREPDLRARLAATAGLRSAVRRAAVGAIEPAIVDLLAQRVRAGRPEAALIAHDGGRLWLGDAVFAELAYDLELDAAGGIAGESASAPPALRWRRFLAWAADGGEPGRGRIAHPRWPGSFPAWSLPAGSRLRPLAAALRRHPGGPRCVGAAPGLTGWWDDRLPDAAAGAARDDAGFALSPQAWDAARERDPWLATAAALARIADQPTGALAGIVRLAVESLLQAASDDGPRRRIAVPRRGAGVLVATRRDGALAVEVDGLAGVLAWLGLVPGRYDLRRGAACWDFATLLACGWDELIERGWWRPVQVGEGAWLALAAPSPVPLPWPSAPPPAARCAMRLDC